jgi:trimethylguanosine synthase
MEPIEIKYNKILWLKLFDSYNSKLKMSNVGVYSITKPYVALKFIIYIMMYAEENNIIINNVIDSTAGLGGITRYLIKFIKNVISIEKNKLHYEICKFNMNIFEPDNKIKFINNNFISLIDTINNQDLIICDPPWGGPSYKNKETNSLFLDDINIYIIINKLFNENKCKIFCLITMLNYNFKDLDNLNKNIDYTIFNVRNVLLICFSIKNN